MDNLPLLHELLPDQKDALLILLWEENQALKKQVAVLQVQVDSLQAQIDDLTQKLNSNSQNSHKPPSSDGFKRVKVKREKSNKKTGGQTGHKGHALQRSNNPDYIVEHPVETCSNCKSNIKDAISLGYKIAQVFEIPLLKVQVTEHRIFEKVCPCCGKICSAHLPEGVAFGLQYGNRLRSFLIYLHHYHYLSSDRISEFFSDVFNHSISEGVVFISEEEAFINLEQFEYAAKELLKKEKVLHADETSLRVDNHKEWLHVLSSTNLTQYFIHQKRGKIATDEMGVLPFFKGILVHDHWKPYFQYECEHALCNAHHLRELRAVSEGTNHLWAEEMRNFLEEIKQTKEENNLSNIKIFEIRYNSILKKGFKEASQVHERGPPKRKHHPKEICLLDRLKKRKKQVLAFMYKAIAPFTNNLAERDIRMMKLKMKVSGCFRKKSGAQIFCRIRGYISTMKKRCVSVLDALEQALRGNAYPAF